MCKGCNTFDKIRDSKVLPEVMTEKEIFHLFLNLARSYFPDDQQVLKFFSKVQMQLKVESFMDLLDKALKEAEEKEPTHKPNPKTKH